MSEIRVTNILGENGNSPVNFTQGINMSGIVTATSFVPTQGQLSHRNLIINGAMQVAQRGTSSTSEGYQTVDRFQFSKGATDETPQQAQVDVASGTTPYTLGFRKAFKVTNGNQTSGVGATDFVIIQTKLEAQDIANSGWNYLSSSSYITFSFWIKSSVAQSFQFVFKSIDGSRQLYLMETGSLTANTWTKVTKTIPGNSNLAFDNDANQGLQINLVAYSGSSYANDSGTVNAWQAYADGIQFGKSSTSTWYTTNDATLEITGVQLEVGPVATPFEHRSIGDELARCQRYYYRHVGGIIGDGQDSVGVGVMYADNNLFTYIYFPTTMRVKPSLEVVTGTSYYLVYSNGSNDGFNTFSSMWNSNENMSVLNAYSNDGISGRSAGHSSMVIANNDNAKVSFSAEL